jgi:hypothetical protein
LAGRVWVELGLSGYDSWWDKRMARVGDWGCGDGEVVT